MNDSPGEPLEDLGTAGILAPPPLIFGAALVLGLALGRCGKGAGKIVRRGVGPCAVAAGAALGAASIAAQRAAGTSPNPYARASALVTTGVYAYTRNPAYVGATSIFIGVALYTGSLPALTLLPVALAILDSGVVDREERYLARRFPEAYRSYCDATPRWFSLPFLRKPRQ